jgi:hypothetical protein
MYNVIFRCAQMCVLCPSPVVRSFKRLWSHFFLVYNCMYIMRHYCYQVCCRICLKTFTVCVYVDSVRVKLVIKVFILSKYFVIAELQRIFYTQFVGIFIISYIPKLMFLNVINTY